MTPEEFERQVELVMSDPRFIGTRKQAENVVKTVYAEEIPNAEAFVTQRKCDCGADLDDDQEDSCLNCFMVQLEVEDAIAIAQKVS